MSTLISSTVDYIKIKISGNKRVIFSFVIEDNNGKHVTFNRVLPDVPSDYDPELTKDILGQEYLNYLILDELEKPIRKFKAIPMDIIDYANNLLYATKRQLVRYLLLKFFKEKDIRYGIYLKPIRQELISNFNTNQERADYLSISLEKFQSLNSRFNYLFSTSGTLEFLLDNFDTYEDDLV